MKRLAIITSLIIFCACSIAFANTPAQLRQQAKDAMTRYDFDRASSAFNAYQNALKKNKMSVDSAALSASRSIPRLRQALENVEDIVIFDSLEVLSAINVVDDSVTVVNAEPMVEWGKIIEAVGLPVSAGQLLLSDGLPFIENPDYVDGPVFVSADGITAFWSALGPKGKNMLYEATRMTSGEWDVQPVTDIPAPAYSPFLLDDGMTLYYTTNAYHSLGGRDVMMSIRDDVTEQWREPANLGMPVNSPADELLYVVDAADSIGWFVTMRTGNPVVYTFKVNDMRMNLSPDKEDLPDRARISAIEDTWPEDFDRSEWLERVEEARDFTPAEAVEERVDKLPDGRTFVELCETAHGNSVVLIEEYESQLSKLQKAENDLKQLREDFEYGNRSEEMRKAVIDAETNVDLQRARLMAKKNKILKSLGYK